MTQRVGFIGAGKMATALARGLVAAGFTSADQIVASDVYPAARQQFAEETRSRAVETNAEVVAASQIVILAVKPQQMSSVLAELKGKVTAQHLVISIAAGVPLKTLVAGLGEKTRLVRVMPNTPCLVGASASGFAIGGAATKEDAALVEQLLSAVGVAVSVDEKLLDAVTGLSGSGPAYVYQIIEALKQNGGRLPFDDSSSPESIRGKFSVSKKAFKQATGKLFKARRIKFLNPGIELLEEKSWAPGERADSRK